ncbi:MAG: PH domain-containing protein [Thermoplasmata archaeon]|nr:PH domain-containing protein [Thermoplasmata archaeon]
MTSGAASPPTATRIHASTDPGPFLDGFLVAEERGLLSVRPRIQAFLGIGPVVFVGVALFVLGLGIAAFTPVSQQFSDYLTGPNGTTIPAPPDFDTILLGLALLSGFGALLWRQIAQSIRLGLAALGFFAVPSVYFEAYVYAVPSANPSGAVFPPLNASNPLAPTALLNDLWSAYGIAALVAVLLVVLLPMACSLLTWRRTEYALTDRRLLTTTGMAGRYVRDAPLDQIRDVTTDQGILGRSMDYGDVIFSSGSAAGTWWGLRAGRHGLGIAWLGVADPFEVRRRVKEATDRGRREGARGGSRPPT